MSHDKPVWKSRFPSCPLDQVSIWYVVLPARPVSLESTVELSKAENFTGDPVRVQKSSELLVCKIWLHRWTLTTLPCSPPAASPASLPCLLPPQGLRIFYSGLEKHQYGHMASFLQSSAQMSHSEDPCLNCQPRHTLHTL